MDKLSNNGLFEYESEEREKRKEKKRKKKKKSHSEGLTDHFPVVERRQLLGAARFFVHQQVNGPADYSASFNRMTDCHRWLPSLHKHLLCVTR